MDQAVTAKATSRNRDVYTALKRDIACFHFKPGERLREEALSKRYGVSRTPIRDALRGLEQEGLVEAKHGGRFVRQFNVREFEDIYRVRAVIERTAAIQACERATDEAIAALCARLDDTVSDSDEPGQGYHYADVGFHVGVARLSANAFLLGELARINDRIWIFRMVDFASEERIAITRGEHAEIVEAIAERDQQRAGRLMEAHINGAMMNVSTLMTQALAQIYLSS
ncbi:MAG: GntR family transcriptional regulator [Solirubrobacteraceae bacterium]